MTKKSLFVVGLMWFATAAWGQSSADLSTKYRQVTSYEVRAHVLMTPRYASNGQVCEMVLEKRQKNGDRIDFRMFSAEEVDELLKELVPEIEPQKNSAMVMTTVDGGFITTTYTYEDVRIEVHGVTRPLAGDSVIVALWPKRECSEDKSSANKSHPDR